MILRKSRSIVSLSCLFAIVAWALPASAVPTPVTHSDLPMCDFLAVPSIVDELGDTPAFPPDERIVAVDFFTGGTACTVDGAAPNMVITMTNVTTIDFAQVWYVADPETSISNFDGLVNGELAFQIDSVGINAPLVFESIAADGIFEAGETWDFLLIDYVNGLGLAADDFFSIGVGGLSPGSPSSGSIIAVPVPESSTALLLAGGLLWLARDRRRDSH